MMNIINTDNIICMSYHCMLFFPKVLPTYSLPENGERLSVNESMDKGFLRTAPAKLNSFHSVSNISCYFVGWVSLANRY